MARLRADPALDRRTPSRRRCASTHPCRVCSGRTPSECTLAGQTLPPRTQGPAAVRLGQPRPEQCRRARRVPSRPRRQRAAPPRRVRLGHPPLHRRPARPARDAADVRADPGPDGRHRARRRAAAQRVVRAARADEPAAAMDATQLTVAWSSTPTAADPRAKLVELGQAVARAATIDDMIARRHRRRRAAGATRPTPRRCCSTSRGRSSSCTTGRRRGRKRCASSTSPIRRRPPRSSAPASRCSSPASTSCAPRYPRFVAQLETGRLGGARRAAAARGRRAVRRRRLPLDGPGRVHAGARAS